MALVGGTRIDDRDLAAPDDVAVGAEKRVGPGIVGHDAANAGADLLGHAIIDILAAVEGKLRRHDLRELFVFSLIAPIVAERILGGSAALLAALTFPSHFAENKALMRALPPQRVCGAPKREFKRNFASTARFEALRRISRVAA